MKAMKSFLALAVLGLTLVGCTIPAETPAAVTPVIEEDEPGWDCATMGNLACTAEELEGQW